jgi:acyl-CoA synthetase (NDP forming)
MTEPGHPVPVEVGNERLPAYAFPENAARALGKVVTYAEWRRQEPGLYWGFDDLHVDDARRICRVALDARGDTWLSDEEVRNVLGAFGLPLVAGVVAHNADEAAALAAAIGWPVAAKLSSAYIQHKSDIGAVRLNLRTEAAVRQAFADILSAAQTAGHPLTDESDDGVLIQSMVGSGVETMMGTSHDPLFGPLIAFGLGGVYVEVLGDVRFRVAPLTDHDVDELLHEIKGFRLLEGYRGHPAADIQALRDLLLRLSRLADEIPEISELDLNPVIALSPGQGCRIVDARIRVKSIRRGA